MAAVSTYPKTSASANLLSIFYDRNPSKRLQAMSQAGSPDVKSYDSQKQIRGHAAVGEFVPDLLGASHAWIFVPAVPVSVNNNCETLE